MSRFDWRASLRAWGRIEHLLGPALGIWVYSRLVASPSPRVWPWLTLAGLVLAGLGIWRRTQGRSASALGWWLAAVGCLGGAWLGWSAARWGPRAALLLSVWPPWAVMVATLLALRAGRLAPGQVLAWLQGGDGAFGAPRSVKDPPDLVLGRGKLGVQVRLPGPDRGLHMLVVGPTGSGKTSSVLLPMIRQDLDAMAAGRALSLTVVEPKGDFAADVCYLAEERGLHVVRFDLLDEDGPVFNPLAGDPADAAKRLSTVIANMLGGNLADFYTGYQASMVNGATYAAKLAQGQGVTLKEIYEILNDKHRFMDVLNDARPRDPWGVQKIEQQLHQNDRLFTQIMAGTCSLLWELVGNPTLRRRLCGAPDMRSPVLDPLEHIRRPGGVLVVNTAMQHGRVHRLIGQLVIMTLQQAGYTRDIRHDRPMPHVLYVDEAPQYAYRDLESLLAIGRGLGLPTVLCCQTLEQLRLPDYKEFVHAAWNNCRQRIVFGGQDPESARYIAEAAGKERYVKASRDYRVGGILGLGKSLDGVSEEEDERYILDRRC